MESRRLPNGLHSQQQANGKTKANEAKASSRLDVAAVKPGPGLLRRAMRRLISSMARLLTWYAIITIAFFCPSDFPSPEDALENAPNTPKICVPYLHARNALAPHLAPYYDTYAAPYVEIVRPYYESVDGLVLQPAYGYARSHVEPRVLQAGEYGREKWDARVQPRIDEYRQLALAKYDEAVAPHVRRVSDALEPHVVVAANGLALAYREHLLPAYELARPHAVRGYRQAVDFSANALLPAAQRTWTRVRLFLHFVVWPRIRTLYVESVEPQLMRIGERLGRHKQGHEQEHNFERVVSPVESGPPSDVQSTASQSASAKASREVETESAKTEAVESKTEAIESKTEAVESKTAAVESKSAAVESANTASATPTTVGTAPIPSDEADQGQERPVPEIVAEDLKKWESKYAQAAEEGVAAIKEGIQDISTRMIAQQVRTTGQALLGELRAAAGTEAAGLRAAILEAAASSSRDGSEQEDAEAVSAAARRAGLAVKDKAQRIRSWRREFDLELQSAINEAAQSHVRILEEIRDLALQKIGMKWAWMDGVTYKNWQSFHELRTRLTGWTEEVKNLLVAHPGIEEARGAAADVEGEAMDVAQEAARELAALKRVGILKVSLGDASDDFDLQSVEERLRKASRDMGSTKGGDTESAKVKEEGDGQGRHVAKGKEEGDGEVDEPRNAETRTVTFTNTATVSVHLRNAAHEDRTAAHEDLPELGQASTAQIIGGIPVVSDNQSVGQDDSPGHDSPSHDGSHTPHKDIHEGPLEPQGQQGPAQDAVKPVFMGAAAQAIPKRDGPILDDDNDDDTTESLFSSLSSKAQLAYALAVSKASARYSTAMSVVTAQMHDSTPEPVHDQLFAGVSSRYGAALASASAQLSSALDAASKVVHGGASTATTTHAVSLPTAVDWARVEAIAAERLNEGRVWAEMQYSSAKIALGLATPTPSPTPSSERYLEMAKLNYYAGLGYAQARYDEFVAAASSALSSLAVEAALATATATATATPSNLAESASSLASAASEAAAAAASGAVSGVSSIVSEADDTTSSIVAAVGDKAAVVGGHVVDRWDGIVSQISERIYGAEPTALPWYGQLFEETLPQAAATAAAKLESVASEVSEAFARGSQEGRAMGEKDEL